MIMWYRNVFFANIGFVKYGEVGGRDWMATGAGTRNVEPPMTPNACASRSTASSPAFCMNSMNCFCLLSDIISEKIFFASATLIITGPLGPLGFGGDFFFPPPRNFRMRCFLVLFVAAGAGGAVAFLAVLVPFAPEDDDDEDEDEEALVADALDADGDTLEL
eukprot:TRINITY_DN22354_c1_g1_i1.p2 TRINITY_DN22354_c1_g1~~TRINITY_DN22354_c1_g1_i1.p2  ORF type:complete len:162 (-),score=6.06 TRINITY_DN22354_c1_g1_i1:603-1088(-)